MTIKTQKVRGGQIGFAHHAPRVEGQIPDGCHVVEMGKTVARGFEVELEAAQFLVLHFQFGLMDTQLVNEPLRIRIDRFGCCRRGFREQSFGPPPQPGHLACFACG